MKRFLATLLVLSVLTSRGAAYADPTPAASSAAQADSAPAPSGAATQTSAHPAVTSDLDEELPPDVRAKLTPNQLHEVMMTRASKGREKGVEVIVPVAFFAMVLGTLKTHILTAKGS